MDGFTFWKSYFDALKQADPETVKSVLVAMGDYMFNDEEPELCGLPSILFEAFRGNLDTSKRRSAAGRKGGEYKQNASKTEANEKQNASKTEALKTKTKTKTKTKKEEQKKNNQDEEDSTEKEKQLSLKGGAGGKQFSPPTLQEVRNYCMERNSPVDPVAFFDYFTTGNWHDSEGKPVRNWKQKLITWEKKQNERGKRDEQSRWTGASGGGVPAIGGYGKRTWTEADIRYD